MNEKTQKTQDQGTQIDTFDYKDLGSIRCYLDKRKMPWFCLVDICSILGIKNSSRVKKRLYERGVCSTPVIYSLGRIQQATFIDQCNLMELIFNSRKSGAEEFRTWVFDILLPALRGKAYPTPKTMTIPQAISLLAKEIVDQRAMIDDLVKKYEALNELVSKHFNN